MPYHIQCCRTAEQDQGRHMPVPRVLALLGSRQQSCLKGLLEVTRRAGHDGETPSVAADRRERTQVRAGGDPVDGFTPPYRS